MRSPFRWTGYLRRDSKAPTGAILEFVDDLPDDLSQEFRSAVVSEPVVAEADPDTAPEPVVAEADPDTAPEPVVAEADPDTAPELVVAETEANTFPNYRTVAKRILAGARSRIPSKRRVVTLSTEKDALRVVVFQGRKVVAWGSADPSYLPGAPGNPPDAASPEIEKEIAESALRSILTELGIGRTRNLWSLLDRIGIRRDRTVMDLSLYTTLTRQLQIPKVKGRYQEQVVLSEVLASLPFSREEVEILWQIRQDNVEDDSVFAVAMPKQRLNAQILAAKEAGLAPAAAYSKSAALASVSGVLNGIVIHLETSDAALVLVQDGYTKTVHEVEYGTDESSPETKANNLARAFGQVASYYQPADPQEQELPVILTGMTGETDRISQLLREKIQRRTLTIEPPLEYPQNFPVEEYAINLGLFLTDQLESSQENKGPGRSLSLNLLPKHHLPSALPVFPAVVFVILLLLALHPVNIMGKVDAKILEKDSFSSQVSLLRGQQRQINAALSTFQESQAELAVVSLQANDLDIQMDILGIQLSTQLDQISSMTRLASEQKITLSQVAPRGTEGFGLSGSAGSHAELLAYVQGLRDHPLFEDALVLNVAWLGGADPGNDDVVTFTAQVFKAIPIEPEEETEGAASE